MAVFCDKEREMEKDMNSKRKWLAVFGAVTGICLTAMAALVIYVDPFFQYHKPLPGFPYVLENQITQNPGIAKNMDYDSIILGSSMVVQFNTQWFEDILGLNTIKLPFNAAHAKDQDRIMTIVEKHHGMPGTVFLGIDLLPYANGTDAEAYPVSSVYYDDNLLNDVEYWWNRDVLLDYIVAPYIGKDEADDFHIIYAKYYYPEYYNRDYVLSNYIPPEKSEEEVPEDAYVEAALANMEEHILPHIENNPDTEFYVFFPPYSILFWYNCVQGNTVDARLAEYNIMMESLFRYDNVRVFFFQNDPELICNLDRYTDYTHYDREVNLYMTQCFADGTREVTPETCKEELEAFREVVNSFDFTSLGLQ